MTTQLTDSRLAAALLALSPSDANALSALITAVITTTTRRLILGYLERTTDTELKHPILRAQESLLLAITDVLKFSELSRVQALTAEDVNDAVGTLVLADVGLDFFGDICVEGDDLPTFAKRLATLSLKGPL
jgi:hypothetical protein